MSGSLDHPGFYHVCHSLLPDTMPITTIAPFLLILGGMPGMPNQVGDALVRVNHEQLNLLNHENVVRVLRGLLLTTGSQVLLLRFAYAEDSPRMLRAATVPSPPPPPLPPKTPVPRPSITGNPRSEPRVSQGGLDKEEAFRSESWHGSSKPPRRALEGQGQGQGREMSRSVSPHRHAGPAVLRSQSLGEGPSAVAELARKGSSGAEAGDKEGRGWTVEGVRPRGKRRGELWGEPEMGLAGGDGGSRHIYLGDMGHARVQRTLQAIAEDVQVHGHCSSCAGEVWRFLDIDRQSQQRLLYPLETIPQQSEVCSVSGRKNGWILVLFKVF